jgi:hemerythrin-like metal-binding protein
MEWTAALEVGYPVIDKQHRELVAILNDVVANMNKPDAQAALLKAFDKLANYTIMHFRTEEMLMAQHRYPGAEAHKRMHADLVKQVGDLQRDLKAGKAMIGSKTLFFLKTWLTEHIQKTDKELAKFLNTGQKAA